MCRESFASAHPMWVASVSRREHLVWTSSLPQRIPCGLHHLDLMSLL